MNRLVPSLPRIKVPIGHIHQKLKDTIYQGQRGRLELLRRMCNRIIREERCEFKYNRAEECRQYLERLIQLGVYRGIDDAFTKEMFEWWLIEKDVYEKMIEIIIPRCAKIDEPFSSLYLLPKIRLPQRINIDTIYWAQWNIGVLEIKGHPFQSIEHLEESRKNLMVNVVKKALNEQKLI